MNRIFILALILSVIGCTDDGLVSPYSNTPCFEFDGQVYTDDKAYRFEIGECRVGYLDYQDNDWACANQVGPSQEVCDGLDNDCDGRVDNDWGMEDETLTNSYAAKDNPCKQQGKCAYTNEVCMGGEWVCDYQEPPTVDDNNCNGVDDDCDGEVDEDYENYTEYCYDGEDGTLFPGSHCSPGFVVCVEGNKECVDQIIPSQEFCDGLDNDCDGQVDEIENELDEIDLVFALDVSGSMQDTLNAVKTAICNFAAAEDGDSYKFGLVLIANPYNSYSLRKNLTNAAEICEEMETFFLLGSQEPQLDATFDIVDSQNPFMLNWRPNAQRVMVGFTDEVIQSNVCEGDPLCMLDMMEDINDQCIETNTLVYWFAENSDYFQEISNGCGGSFQYLIPEEEYILERLNTLFSQLCLL